ADNGGKRWKVSGGDPPSPFSFSRRPCLLATRHPRTLSSTPATQPAPGDPAMKRFLVALTVLVVCAAAAHADQKPTRRWHGQSFFDLTTSKGTRIVFDPHAIEAYGRQNVSADLVLLSHFHTDHTRIEVIDNVKKAKILTGLKDLKGDGKQVEWNALDETFKD